MRTLHQRGDDDGGRGRDNRNCNAHRGRGDARDDVRAHDGARDNRNHNVHRGRDDARDDVRARDGARGSRNHNVHRGRDDVHDDVRARDGVRGSRNRYVHRDRGDARDDERVCALQQVHSVHLKEYLFLKLHLQSACRQADPREL